MEYKLFAVRVFVTDWKRAIRNRGAAFLSISATPTETS